MRCSSSAGFSLFEAMISLAVFALATTAVLTLLSTSARLQSKVHSSYLRAELAKSISDQYRVVGPSLGTEGTEAERWHWTVVERKIGTQPETGPSLYLITISVSDRFQDMPATVFETIVVKDGWRD